jgi:hypothetical protein
METMSVTRIEGLRVSFRESCVPQVMPFPSERERLFATLSPDEREFVERLLQVSPNYRYELSGLPKLDPMPAPGVESAIAAAKAVGAFHAEWGGGS